jgi:O-methyltransferase domain/Dimerisation domain
MANETATAKPVVPPYLQVLDIAVGYFRSRALTVAAELEVADHLAAGPLHVDELAKRTQTHAPTVFRLLRALESIGVFAQVSPRVFANTPASETLRQNIPGSIRTILLATSTPSHGQFEAWTGLLDSVKTGTVAFDRIYGHDFWEFLKRNPAEAELFNDSMAAGRSRTAAAVATAYDWSQFAVIADIGGGIGGQLVEILKAHPACRGILFDLPEGLQGAAPHERIEVVSGNFFESVPSGADAYTLRSVVHDWSDERAAAILRSVRKAMKPGACAILIESVVAETPEPDLSKWLDLLMLVVSGGKERTATEFRKLLEESGFELERIVSTPSGHGLIIGRPI